jgi:hypothetical protein
VGFALGPGNWTDPSRVDQGLHAAFEEPLHVGVHRALEVETGSTLVNIAPTGLLTFTPETIGNLALFGSKVTIGSIANGVLWGRLGLDALVFAESLVVCAVR